ncbi:hypothetical protein [Mesorhizobium silamurunense]|nr:hypothetical protein [Mesorhizobium silamurunense]
MIGDDDEDDQVTSMTIMPTTSAPTLPMIILSLMLSIATSEVR